MDDSTLTQTVCALLAGAGDDWAWRPEGPAYEADEVGIFYGAYAAGPDRAVGVALYQTDDDVVTGLAVRRVQIRYRGARAAVNGADALASAGFAVLQGLTRVDGLSQVRRVLMAPLGTDSNARQERADSYQIVIDNPEATP